MTWCSKCRAPRAIESSGQCRANVSWCPKHRLRNRALKSVMSPTTMKRKSFLNHEKTQVEQVLTQKHKLFLAGLAGVLISYRHQGQLASDPRVLPSHTPITVPASPLSSVGRNPGELVHSSLSPLINAEKHFIPFLNGFSTGNGINKTIKLLPDMT